MGEAKKQCNYGRNKAALLAQIEEHKRLVEKAKENLEKAKKLKENMKEKVAKKNTSKSVN